MKIKMLIALIAAVAFVGTTTGCGDEKKADDKKEAKDDKKDKKDGDKKDGDKKDGDTKEAKADGDVPKVCQEYMDAWKKCEEKMPEASKNAMKPGYEAFTKQMEDAKGDADKMKVLETTCKAGVDALKPVCK